MTRLEKEMKFIKYFFLSFYFLFGGVIFSQQIIFHIGDNIMEYINRNPPQFLRQGTFLYDIPDGGIDFLLYKTETSEKDTKFLVQGSSVFGVMQYENNTTKFLYDITGDGELDVSHDSLLVPFWVLTKSVHTKISKNNNVLRYLDNGIKMFNDNEDPYKNDAMRKYVAEFSSLINTSTVNRDLFYGILEYYRLAQYPALALMIISELGIRYNERFGNIHPLISLHVAESLMNSGNGDLSVGYINNVLATNPNCVPAKVYSWQLEKDPAAKQKKYNDLKTNYRNHWIVKQI
jgi:hypothetical protein